MGRVSVSPPSSFDVLDAGVRGLGAAIGNPVGISTSTAGHQASMVAQRRQVSSMFSGHHVTTHDHLLGAGLLDGGDGGAAGGRRTVGVGQCAVFWSAGSGAVAEADLAVSRSCLFRQIVPRGLIQVKSKGAITT